MKATGVAAGENKEAEIQAERQALRRAVEQALGQTIEATLAVEHRRVVREKILSHVDGFVARYRSRSPVVKDGATSVTVEAVVKTGEMKDELAAIRRVLEGKRMPRLMVIMGPFDENGEPDESARLAGGAIESAFVDRGFRLVDEAGAASAGGGVYNAFVRNQAEAVAEAARSQGAEVVLAGSASLKFDREAELYGRKVKFHKPSVTLRAVETGTGRVIFSRERTGTSSARTDALPTVATELAEQCVEAVIKQWQSEIRNLETVVVRVSGITFEGFARLRRAAESISGVQGVRTRPFAGETGELEVEHVRDPLDLARSFTALPDLPLQVVKATVQLIELRVGK